jgi:nitrogen-specific signal transduction histidine kinase
MLTAILASTEHLERANVDADHKVDLQIIREATRRAGDLTEKLLSFARRKLLSVDHLDIGDIANELAPLLKRLLGEHIELFVTREPGCRGVKTDRTSLEQVLINLAVNARDAMPNGGSLTIEVGEVELDDGWVARGASRPGAHVCVTVTDTGTGMTADVQARAFEPFFTTKRPGSGSGLGLASVYGFMKQSEGHVELKSVAGKGTVFTLYFPVADAVPKMQPVRETHRRPLNGKPATVLIVDDEPLVLQAVQRALLHEGFEVHVASTGATAIDLARMIENLDIVITDVLMPSMSGPELARKLRENGCEAPILFVSGHTHGELSERGVLLSGVEFLQKPFTERDLAKRVRGILMPVIEA